MLDNYRFNESATDDDLVEIKNKWLKESQPYHDWMLLYQNKCLQYYRGNQTLRDEVSAFNSDTVYNRIFEATETIVPIVTRSAHRFVATPGDESELSITNAKSLQKVLERKYGDLEIQSKLEIVVRDMILKRFGIVEWGWDIENDDIGVWAIDPRNVLIPRFKLGANSLPYVMVVEEYTREELEDNFPGIDIDRLTQGATPAQVQITGYSPVSSIDITRDTSRLYYVLKVVTDDYWCWFQNDIVIRKEKNRYWDWDGEDEKVAVTRANGKVVKKTFKRFYNFLDRPTKPYVFFTPFTTGDSPIADMSLAEIAIPIQDDINIQKRAIVNNLVRMGNGQVYIDADSLTQEVIDQISSEPGLILVGKGLASENRIRREQGVPLPQAHFQNLQLSLLAFDNIFGTHGSLRGMSTARTVGGQTMDRMQDLSRIDQFTSEVNRGMNLLADGLTQLMKMFYDEPHVIPLIGRDGALSFLSFTRKNIEDNVILDVKSGVPVMLDDQARSNRAIQLWQLGGIDPESFFEELNFSDPQDMAKKLAAWKQGQLLLEAQVRAQETQAGIAAKAQADAALAAGGGGAPPAPVKPPAGGSGGMPMRRAEVPAASADRARMALSGSGKVDLSGVLKTANT